MTAQIASESKDARGRWRVAITGMGVKTPAGCDLDTYWQTVLAGASLAAPIRNFDAGDYPVRFACEVQDYEPSDYLPAKSLRRMDRVSQLGFGAAMDAVGAADLSSGDPARRAIVFGIGTGGMGTMEDQCRVLHERGPDRVSPFLVPMMMPNATAAFVAMELGWTGPSFSVNTACASSASAIGEAAKLVRYGECEVVLAGGGEAAVAPWFVAAFSRMGSLSSRNDDPRRASRPFDAERDGYVISEGAAFLVLERLDLAQARGARIYGELTGYGATSDAHHITAPSPEGAGAAACIELALMDAELSPTAIGHVNAHGTSTVLNDAMEAKAVRKTFGEAAPPVTASKSVFGHLMGGAGAAEAVVAVLAMNAAVIPPTANHENLAPDCAPLDVVSGEARPIESKPVVSNSFGFGGHNVSLVFGPLGD